ncbi:MAG: winged helix-turn-helix domain-containing protein, partial [Myxococcota bacterium]
MKQVWLRNGQLDISRQIFVRDGQRPRPVRELEAKLLSYLAARPNRVIPYAELLVEVWGYRPEHPPGVIHTTVRRLRKVIGDSARSPQHIFNVRGEGFRFVPAMARPEDTMLPAESASPADPDPIIGRTQALDTLATLVAANPLVSVVGVGGVGKTRLVRELMDAQISAFPEGLFFVDLTAVRDLLGSCVAVADALAVPVSQRDPIDSLGQSLADRGRVMLVLDNAETVIDELKPVAVAWAKTMAQTGGRLVLTSRRRLDVPIEQVFPLKPLQLPEPTGSAEAVATSAAGQLFLRRARARRAHLRQTPQTLSALGALLRDLDGLPLAIELAAAHARLLSPGEIHARLREAGLQDLRTGPRPDRHRSLNAALAWSWSLLDETHRAALAQCSLFEGGFTVRAAEAILQLPDPNVEVIAVIDHLVEHHLLYSAGDPPRLEMLATVRAFAVAKRTDANASSAWTPATAFARYYAAFADQPRQAGRPELGNLRVGARIGDGDAAARCALAALNLIRRAHVSEATALLKDALQRDGLSNRTHARLLDVRVSMARNLPEPPEEIRQYGQTALLLADEMGDRKLACDIEESLGAYLRSVGAVADAEAHYRRAVELAEEIEDAESIAVARTGLAMLYQHSGRRHESHTILREVLAMYEEEVDHPGREGVVLVRLGIFYQGMGRFEQARRCF